MEWEFGLIPLVSGFALTIIFMPLFIGILRIKHEGQQIREEGPKWHEKKAGTPTMGGVIFGLAAFFSAIWIGLWQHALNHTMWILLVAFIGYGVIGFLDDFIKLSKKRNLGLRAYQKLLGQIFIAVVIVLIAAHDHFSFSLWLPLFGTVSSYFIFTVFAIIWLVGFSNAVNLSDGIDGLAAGLSIIAYGTYAFIAYRQANLVAEIFALTVVGGLIGFLLFNHKPAKIFMGDVGSLALGGGLAALAIMVQHPWSLLLIGIVFVIETASVMLQVASFQLTGKRIFKMTPLHHHFELSGYSEWKIDGLFWFVGLIAAILYLIIFK